MKLNKYIAFLICFAIIFPVNISAEILKKTSLEIHENTVVNEINRTMFGVSSDWTVDYLKQTFYGE